jgi:hypothetical protein
VAIIGAGPCGLAAAKELAAAGIAPVVFEKSDRVGGNWVYSPEESHSSVTETTHIISSKRYSQYRDFPMPADYPDYPSHRQLLRYFESYAERFGLGRLIRFRTEVRHCTKLPGERWRLALSDGGAEEFEVLLVANGHHWDPRWPRYPGTFSGRLLHSHAFKTAQPYRDRRVLVIGGGNSACDIAVETSRVAERVGISWRRGYYVVPKLMFGQPPDVLNARLRWLPSAVRQRLHALSWRVITGGNAPYGLPEPDHRILGSHPVLNSELLYFLRHGRIAPYPEIERFDGEEVRFVDGRSERFEVVIAATGFRISFPFFDRSLIDFDDGEVPLYLRMFHPAHPTLMFIGLVQPLGSIWPLAEAQGRLVSRYLEGTFRLPPGIDRAIRGEVAAIKRRFVASPRHSIEVDYHDYLASLERAVGR